MREDREDRLRQRAYAIWEAEGRPDGREREHWAQAERELDADQAPEERPVLPAGAETSSAKKPRKRASTTQAASTARNGKSKAAELRP